MNQTSTVKTSSDSKNYLQNPLSNLRKTLQNRANENQITSREHTDNSEEITESYDNSSDDTQSSDIGIGEDIENEEPIDPSIDPATLPEWYKNKLRKETYDSIKKIQHNSESQRSNDFLTPSIIGILAATSALLLKSKF